MKTRDEQWHDLFGRRGTRRDFLRVGGSVASLVALGTLPGCRGDRRIRFISEPFGLGVASGDPSPDGMVLWTRLMPNALDAAGAPDQRVAVDWEVAEDDAFRSLVQSGTAQALPELGHSVHVEVEGLRPGRPYFYRLIAGGEASPVGRTRTAPATESAVDRFRFAFVSCQHYEQGFYTGYRHMAEEDLDLVVHLGDYIYEGGVSRGGVRAHEGPEIYSLADYRARYTTYKSDTHLKAAHAAAPWIVTWDDHEVDNDYADDAAEDDQSSQDLLLRRAAAYQAYYEFMPLRRSSMPSGPDMQLYRRLRFGDLMDMFVLDTRQYRSRQACGGGRRTVCAELMSPERTLLGAEQKQWLFDGLAGADARWNVLAQQILMARMRRVSAGGEDLLIMDKWDGYPLERQELIDVLAANATPNPVVLTGDIHVNWVADIKADFEDERSATIAAEFVGTSISSGGDGQDVTGSAARLSENPHLKFHNGQRGYVTSTVTPERWTSEYRVVPVVTEPGGGVETRATFVVESGRPEAQEA